MFRAYCYTEDGTCLPHKDLSTAEDVFHYVSDKKKEHSKIVVEDTQGYTVVKVENHKVVYP